MIYKGHSVGEYFADLLVEDALVVELKCAERLANEHTAQCLNYLRASGRTVCLLVNFQNPKSSGSESFSAFPIRLRHEGLEKSGLLGVFYAAGSLAYRRDLSMGR